MVVKSALELGKSFVDNILTFITLFELLGSDKAEDEDETKFTVMLIVCAIFGLVRIIGDSVNLYYFGDDVPDGAPYGDLVGIFGEDLCGICVELMQGPSKTTTFGIISGAYKSLNFAYAAAKIMFAIAAVGMEKIMSGEEDESAGGLVKFLVGVGCSGVYVAIMFIAQSTKDVGEGIDHFLLFYIVYAGCAAIHVLVFISSTPEWIAWHKDGRH